MGALLAASCHAPPVTPPPAAPARHLIILCIDTLRVDHVGAYGYARDTTPHIDALGRRGTRFATVHAQSNWTVPATATLLTSLYPSQHGAGIAGDVRELADDTPVLQLGDDVETLAMRLKKAGFRTALLSANPFLYGRFQRGFDTAVVRRQGAGELTATAIRWLAEPGGQRQFLYMQYMDLHQPIEPPPPYVDLFPVNEGGRRGAEHSGWSYGSLRSPGDLQAPAFRRYRAHRLALYDGALRYIDDEIGRLLREVRRLGQADHTLVIVTSDHGEEFWDHALEEAALGGDPRGLWGIGHGHSMYEELLRVPLILSGPGVPPGRTETCPARHLDAMPTALALLGLPRARLARGRNLVEPMATLSPAGCDELPALAESPAYGPDSRAVLWKGRKLISRHDGVELLFDLRSDPQERHDLAASQPALAAGLRTILGRELAGTGRLHPADAMQLDEETRRQLRALGYLR